MRKSFIPILFLLITFILLVSFKSGMFLPKSSALDLLEQHTKVLDQPIDVKKPNILIIITDQQRIDDMSCAGNAWVKTPALDALASRGIRFTKSYCTSPLCVPSRASLVTSRMPYEVMKHGDVAGFKNIPYNIASIGPIFNKAGYRNAWSGKWHVRSSFPKTEEEGGDLPGFEVLQNKLMPSTVFGKPEPDLGDKIGHNYDIGIAEEAIAFLNQPQTKPFVLTVSLINPHDVCGNNEKKLADFAATIKEPFPPLPKNLNVPNQLITPNEGAHPSKGRKDGWKDISFQRYIYQYYRFTEESDKLIGEVLEALKKNGFEKNTIVIFTSDHGETLGAHHIVMKTVAYEEALAVPFIIAGPGIPQGKVDNKHFISGLDLFPTICGLAGIQAPEEIKGLNVNNIIKNPNTPWREAVFATVDDNQARVTRTERYKYIKLDRPIENEFLFDMQNDMLETKNLSNDLLYADILAHHKILLNDWMEKTNDPFRSIEKNKK